MKTGLLSSLILLACMPFILGMKMSYSPSRLIYNIHSTVVSASDRNVDGLFYEVEYGYGSSDSTFVAQEWSKPSKVLPGGAIDKVDTLDQSGYACYTAARLAVYVGSVATPGPVLLVDSAAQFETTDNSGGCHSDDAHPRSTITYTFKPTRITMP